MFNLDEPPPKQRSRAKVAVLWIGSVVLTGIGSGLAAHLTDIFGPVARSTGRGLDWLFFTGVFVFRPWLFFVSLGCGFLVGGYFLRGFWNWIAARRMRSKGVKNPLEVYKSDVFSLEGDALLRVEWDWGYHKRVDIMRILCARHSQPMYRNGEDRGMVLCAGCNRRLLPNMKHEMEDMLDILKVMVGTRLETGEWQHAANRIESAKVKAGKSATSATPDQPNGA